MKGYIRTHHLCNFPENLKLFQNLKRIYIFKMQLIPSL